MSLSNVASLEEPLPPQLVGSNHGWLTAYKRYPAFGRTWIRLRLRPALLACGGVIFAVLAAVLLTTHDLRGLGGLVVVVANIAVPLVLGPALAHRVRLLGWSEQREGSALLAVLLTVSLSTVLLSQIGAEPLKQAIAAAVGTVDSQGKRLPYRLMIGVTMIDGNPLPGPDPLKRPGLLSTTTLTQTALLFWLAGGTALIGWRREVQGLARIRQEQALARAEAQRREAEMQLSVLAAQVEPHFLFNTLAGVRSAIATDAPRATEMVDRLVEYLRASIPHLRDDGSLQSTVGAQSEAVRAYLALMHARLPRMRYAIHVPDALRAAYCPPLMLISLAENAVKHGVEPKVGSAQVALEVSAPAPERLRVAVLDDGVGFADAGSGSGIGLANIRARLMQLHGDAASLTLRSRSGGGIEAAIELPLQFHT